MFCALLLPIESKKEAEEMKKLCLIILSCLATLVFLTTFAYSAESQFSTAAFTDSSMEPASVVVKSALVGGDTDVALVNIIVNLLDSEAEYGLNESTALVLACSPFADQQSDDYDDYLYQPASNISVSLKFSF
jgi:hypothetical protein